MKTIEAVLTALILFTCNAAWGQASISGAVKDPEGAGIMHAGILLLKPGEQAPVRYTYSDTDGAFRFEQLPHGKYILEISCLGYEKQSVTVQGGEDHEIRVVLQRKPVELNEVIIRQEKPVSVSRDTISILTRYFSSGTERNVEELLRKIPGLNIDDDGTIRVGNQEVEKVMVEGDDFFEKGYKVLTKNMAAYPVSKVEIYRNYSRNKHLKGIESSSQVALNLSLREELKSVWFGNGLAGLGAGRYQLKGNLMNYGKKSKYYFLTHGNNTGLEVMDDLDHLVRPREAGEQVTTGDKQAVHAIEAVTIQPPGLKKQRVTFNNAGLLSLNGIFTLSDKVKLKTLGLINKNRNSLYRNFVQSVASGAMIFENSEEFRGLTTGLTGFGSADLTYDISSVSSLRYTGRFSQAGQKSRNELVFNAAPLNEKLDETSRLTDQNLHLTHKIRQNRVIQVTGGYLMEKVPQNYLLNPFVYRELFPGNSGEVDQSVQTALQMVNVESHMMDRRKNGDLLEVRAGGQWRKESLQSRFQAGEVRESELFQNNMIYSSLDFYLSAKYLKKFNQLQLITQADLHQVFNRVTQHKEYARFFVVPKLGINYTPGKHHKLQASYSYTTQSPGMLDLHPGYIHSGFRTFSRGAEEFTMLNTSTALINYAAGNWGERFFVNTFLLYSRNHTFFSTHTTLSPHYLLTEKIRVNGREAVSLISSADRYFKVLKSNLKVNFSGSATDFRNKVNESALRKVNSMQMVYGWEIRSAFRSFFNYHLGSKWIQNRMRAESRSSFTDRSLFLDLDFRIHRPLNIRLQAEQYYFGRLLKGTGQYYFLDLEARYDLDKLILYVSGNNLFNTKTFRNYMVSDISHTRTEYRLQPRCLLVKAEYRF